MIPIPLLGEPCNRCGACCRHGGQCAFRPAQGLPHAFAGVCALLAELPDGTTECAAIAARHPRDPMLRRLVDGTCDYGTARNPQKETANRR